MKRYIDIYRDVIIVSLVESTDVLHGDVRIKDTDNTATSDK